MMRGANMKIGYRKPNLKKSMKARTTGRAKRSVKRSISPGYGKKGIGIVKNPRKAIYNKVYRKTTRSVYKGKASGCLIFILGGLTLLSLAIALI